MTSTRFLTKTAIGALTAVLLVPVPRGLADDDAALMSTPPPPISSNPADAPPRTLSGEVFASTDVDRPPALGPGRAKVTVLVFSDFQCPVCRRSADATRQIPEEFPGEVRVEFWQNALPMHRNAENAAVASLAAQRQGKFWEYHDELFRNQGALDAPSLALHAERAGLDVERFRRDYEAPELRERVKREGAAAARLGATSTPSFVINGKLNTGWGSWLSFRSAVERELAEARKLEAGGTPLPQIEELRAKALVSDPDKLQGYRELVLDVRSKDAPPSRAESAAGKPAGSDKREKKKRRARSPLPSAGTE